MKYFLGIDGGGTKTAALICREDGTAVFEKRYGPSNPNDITFEKTAELLSEIARDTSEFEIAAVFAGLSGGINYRDDINKHLTQLFPSSKIGNGSDADNIIWAGLGSGNGCGIISGTGSICFVRKNGRSIRIGGWGWLLDGAGGGYDVGRDAVSASLRHFDGRGEHTILTDMLTSSLGAPPWERITEIYSGDKPFIASLAPLVFEAYRKGDTVANQIMMRAAEVLAEYTHAAAAHFEAPFKTVLAGSLLCARPELYELLAKLCDKKAQLSLLDVPPVYGAVKAAAAL